MSVHPNPAPLVGTPNCVHPNRAPLVGTPDHAENLLEEPNPITKHVYWLNSQPCKTKKKDMDAEDAKATSGDSTEISDDFYENSKIEQGLLKENTMKSVVGTGEMEKTSSEHMQNGEWHKELQCREQEMAAERVHMHMEIGEECLRQQHKREEWECVPVSPKRSRFEEPVDKEQVCSKRERRVESLCGKVFMPVGSDRLDSPGNSSTGHLNVQLQAPVKRNLELEAARQAEELKIQEYPSGISASMSEIYSTNKGHGSQHQRQSTSFEIMQKHGDGNRKTPQPSTSDRTFQQKSSNTLKEHMALVRGEKLQAVLPVVSTPDRCDVGNSSNLDFDKKIGNIGDGKNVEKDMVKIRKTIVKTKDTPEDRKGKLRGKDKVDDTDKIDLMDDTDTDKIDLMDDTDTYKIGLRIKLHVCNVCSNAFTEAGLLKTHKLVHTSLKQHVCDVCSKAFSSVSVLKRHKFIHTGLKPFVCDECSKAFNLASNLKKHKLIHTGLKPFVCDVCSKAFTTAGSLRRHKLIHTGLKQHVCV